LFFISKANELVSFQLHLFVGVVLFRELCSDFDAFVSTLRMPLWIYFN